MKNILEASEQLQQQLQLHRSNRYYILTIDDNEFNNIVLKLFLERLLTNVEVICAADGLEGLAKLEERHSTTGNGFDLIFLDLSMPEIDGYETFKLISELSSAKQFN